MLFRGCLPKKQTEKFNNFDQALAYGKDQFENNLESTLQSPGGIHFIVRYLCLLELQFHPTGTSNFDDYLGIYAKSPWDIKEQEYRFKNAKELHKLYHDERMNLVQRARGFKPNEIEYEKQDYIQCANQFYSQQKDHIPQNIIRPRSP